MDVEAAKLPIAMRNKTRSKCKMHAIIISIDIRLTNCQYSIRTHSRMQLRLFTLYKTSMPKLPPPNGCCCLHAFENVCDRYDLPVLQEKKKINNLLRMSDFLLSFLFTLWHTADGELWHRPSLPSPLLKKLRRVEVKKRERKSNTNTLQCASRVYK